ncbi:MAG TPA: hypothetical protein VF678_10155 [bacterium]
MTSRRPASLWLRAVAFAGAALAAFGLAIIIPSGGAIGGPATLPEFKRATPDAWVNSAPLTRAALQGKVVLLEVYTSG